MVRDFMTYCMGLLSLILLIFLSACGEKDNQVSLKVPPPSSCIKPIQKDYPDQILILLLGRDAFPGTEKATVVLDDYVKNKPSGVTVLRVDVPLPGETLEPFFQWSHSFDRIYDNGRVIADQLSFFYYPTLYIFDKDGVLRFQGGCDIHEFPAIVNDILAEKSGDQKRIYSRIMLRAGTQAPLFSAKKIDGLSTDLQSISGNKGILIFFARETCALSLKELDNLDRLVAPLNREGIATVVIVQDEGKSSLESFRKYADRMTIIPDVGNTIFNKYSVTVTPYFYLVGNCGTIFSHRSFTERAAISTVNGYLEQELIKDSLNSWGAG